MNSPGEMKGEKKTVRQDRPDSFQAEFSSFCALAKVYLQSGAYQEAGTYAQKALDLAGTEDCEAAVLLTEALWRQGRQSDAASLRARLHEFRDRLLQAEVQLLDARLLIEQGLYTECLRLFGHLHRRPLTFVPEIWLQLKLAQCYSWLHDRKSAREGIEWALVESSRIGWTEGTAHSLMGLALLDRVDGQWTDARDRMVKAKEIFARLGLFRPYVLASLNLGLQRLWQGELALAEETLSEAARLAAEMGDVRVEATARADRGLALVRLNRLSDARNELARSLRLCRRQASPRRVAIALEYTGELHLATGRYDRAATALSRALAIATRIAPEGDIVPEVLRRLAEVALGRGLADEALRIARDADDRAARLGDRYERATAIRVQGEAMRALGRQDEASERFDSALEILEDLGETFERDRVLRLLDPAPQQDEETPRTKQQAPKRRSHSPAQAELLQLVAQHGMIGSSRPLLDVIRQAALLAPTQLPILIHGETGTGKELLARAVHAMGTSPEGPFVAFNCATCPPDLLDAELFGHSRGAFTGANANRLGLVRSAQGGTLFLDEIGELREESQARLLRMLDSGEVRPLGSDQSISVRIRIIAATHADLKERIRQRRFRPDLYFRLAGIRLILPPLRDREGDLRELVQHFVHEARRAVRPGFSGFTDAVLSKMETFHWPGNVRQLRNEILRLAALAPEERPIDAWDPPDDTETTILPLSRDESARVLRDRDRLSRMIQESEGDMSGTARLLGISRGHLYRVLRQKGIDARSLRASAPPSSRSPR